MRVSRLTLAKLRELAKQTPASGHSSWSRSSREVSLDELLYRLARAALEAKP